MLNLVLGSNLRPYYLQTADDHMLDPKAVMFNMSTYCYTSSIVKNGFMIDSFMGQSFNTFSLLISLKNYITHMPINFLMIINDDVMGRLQLARHMSNFTFMHLQLLRKEW